METTQTLKNTENALRDFIAITLKESLGKKWVLNCGVSKERIGKWIERKTEEEKKYVAGVAEERLIYYADFYDLKKIIEKNRDKDFKKVFSSQKTINLYLDILHNFRNPDAHRRELLPHQEYLILGIAGEIRKGLLEKLEVV